MRGLGGAWRAAWVARTPLVAACVLTSLIAGCALGSLRPGRSDGDFFPLAPRSYWEYAVARHGGSESVRYLATVRGDYHTADGRSCRVVDEQYGGESQRHPVVYCADNGFLHRVMSLEYRGEALEDNGLRSGELKFLPTDLRHVTGWEGVTNAYQLPDGSGFEVRQLHRVSPSPERVTVPAGEFPRCVRVETTAIHSAIDVDGALTGPRVFFYYSDWYAPGVGLVKTEQRDGDGTVVTTIELVRYAIAQQDRR